MSQSAGVKAELQADPARFIEREISEFVRTSPANRLPFLGGYRVCDGPLVGFADGDDSLFTDYKSIIAPEHLTPREALAKAYDKIPEDMPEHLSVISWILPIRKETRETNRAETRVPSRLWSHTRWYGEQFNAKLRNHITECLTSRGYLAAAPVSLPFFRIANNEKGQYSNWSERHVAYAAGLGTFSLSAGLITDRGIAHRCGSVVTSLIIPPSGRTAKNQYSNCLFYEGINCRACIERCPAGAITEKGHDKIKCGRYLSELGLPPTTPGYTYDNEKSVLGCGLCQTKVPCEFQNPTKRLKEKVA